VTAVKIEPEQRVDFQHDLFILPPVADAAGPVLWFAYVDEPGKWHRAFPTADALLFAAGELLKKMLAHQRDTTELRRNPNYSSGTQRDVPNLKPRWQVLVTAACTEEDPEWRIVLQDDSAWSTAGYDLRELLTALERRIVAAQVPVQPLLNSVPAFAPLEKITARPSGIPPSGFEKAALDELARIDAAIERHEQAIAGVRAKLPDLKREKRGLYAAVAAYCKHTNPSKGAP
jgi:hypothetical protein